MGRKVNSLIFRSKNFPNYFNIWDNFNLVYKKINFFFNIKIFFKNKKKIKILLIQLKIMYVEYFSCNIVIYKRKMCYISEEYLRICFSSFIFENYSNIKFSFNFMILKHPLLSTYFILNYIFNKLSYARSSIRKIIPQLIMLISKNYKIKGFKCIISGKINGIQMAKSEVFKFNENSFQHKTLFVKYNYMKISTKYGILGIKLWLFLRINC